MLRIVFRSLLLLAILFTAAPARAQSISLSLDALEHPLFSADGLRFAVTDFSGGPADLEIARLRMAGQVYGKLRLRCDDLRWSAERVECPRGVLLAGSQRLPLRFAYAPGAQVLDLLVEPERGERWRLRTRPVGKMRHTELVLENARLERVAGALPGVAAHAPKGQVSGTLTWRGDEVSGELRTTGMSFANAEGTRAGDKLAASIALRARKAGEEWQWQSEIRLDGGEVYWQPFYFASGAHRLTAAGRARAAEVEISRGDLDLGGVGRLTFAAAWDRGANRLRAARFETSALDLRQLAAVFLKPLLEQAGLPKFELAGEATLAGALDAGGLSRLDVGLRGVSFDEPEGRYALRGLEATVPWRRDEATVADIRVAGAGFGRVPLGGFALAPRLNGPSIELPRAEIPVLDGKLVLEGLRVARQEGEWRWQLGGSLEPVSLQRLTGALGVPGMAGAMSAFIPKISYAHSTIEMDGALIIQAFDGFVAARNLRVVEPTGRVPRLYADLEMRHLDLGMLTETYSFGSITGYIDGDVRGLELANWRPQRFQARVASSPGDYRKRISQRAVQNISSLGGASAGAAIQRSFLRFFEQFGYERLGLSCTLAGGVCEMGGVENAPSGYVIVKGGGVPAINVIGYNRRVDWEELVSRIRRVTAGNAKPIIQ